MNGSTIVIIIGIVAVVLALAALVFGRLANKRRAASLPLPSQSAPKSGGFRSAIVSSSEDSPASGSDGKVPLIPAPAPAPPTPQPEPEPEPELTAVQLIATGDGHKHEGQYDEAIEAYEEAFDPTAAEHGHESLEFADLLVKTEDAYLARDNQDDIEELNCNHYLRALSIMERNLGPFDLRLLPVINRIVSFYLLIDKLSEAEGLVRRQQLIELRAKQASSSVDGLAQPAFASVAMAASIDSGNADVDKDAAAGDSALREFDYDSAVDHYTAAVEAAQQSFGRDAIQLVPLLIRQGEAFHARDLLETDSDNDSFTDPLDVTRLALSLLVRESGLRDLRLLPVLTNMVAFSDQTGDHYKADRYIAMIDTINEGSRRALPR